MKKSILAVAGLAAVAGIVAPIAGASALDTSFKDTITVTIDSNCSFYADGTNETDLADGSFSKTMVNGETWTISKDNTEGAKGTAATVVCNNRAGWKVTAVGAGADLTDKTAMNAAGTGTDIPSITAKGDVTTSASAWGMRIDAGTGVSTQYGEANSYYQIPGTAAVVASGPTTGTTGVSFNTGYRVAIDSDQESDIYTGVVEYTLIEGAQS